MKKNVMIWTGAGQIGMAIARRMGYGMKIVVGDKKLENAQTIAEIMNAAGQGDADVKHIIAESMEYLGVGLANVVNFINPKLVLVEGYVMGADENRETLQKTVYENLFGLNSSEVKIEFIPFNKFSGSRGAGMLALKKFLIEQDIQRVAK